VTWAIAAVVVLLVGLPFLAVWWSGRAFWSRARAGRERDPFGDTMRRFGLDAAAMARVQGAAVWGRRLDDPTERAAVVHLARGTMPRRPGSRWTTLVVLAAVGWIAVVVAGAVWATVQGRWGDIPWGTLLFLVPTVWASLAPARAIRRNSD